MTTLIETLAEWAAGRPEFSPVARQRARDAIADTLACTIVGQSDFATQAVRRAYAGMLHPGGASLVVGGYAAPASVAACINGTASHALDYDDNFAPGITHASAVLVPALLAVAQAGQARGCDLVDAYLIGLEAQALVGRGVNPTHYRAGWHATSTVGCIGTAAGVAWLMGLDRDGVARAMSVAASMAAGMKGQFGTPAKPLHAGLAARNAVEAAQFAEAGMTGRLDILECSQGFLELFGGPDAPGWRGAKPGDPHSIESDGLLPKRHPCCGSTHHAVDALLDMKAAHGFQADQIASVHTLVGIANARNLSYDDPQDEMQARFSMNYCAALALTQERLSLADFTPEAVARHARPGTPMARLLPLVTMQSHSAEEERAAAPDRLPHRITVRLLDGRSFVQERRHAKGSLQLPFEDADKQEKFADCTRSLQPGAAATLWRGLDRLDDMPDLNFLAPAFAAPA